MTQDRRPVGYVLWLVRVQKRTNRKAPDTPENECKAQAGQEQWYWRHIRCYIEEHFLIAKEKQMGSDMNIIRVRYWESIYSARDMICGSYYGNRKFGNNNTSRPFKMKLYQQPQSV